MSPRKRTLTAKAAATVAAKADARSKVTAAAKKSAVAGRKTSTGAATTTTPRMKTKTTPRMNTLVTIVPPAQVTDHDKQKATTTWTYWDSQNRKSFTYNYTAEEQILMVKGRAQLIPKDGSPPLTIAAGEQVTIQKGFVCTWKIQQRIQKYYTVAGGEEEDEPPSITCDNCGTDCWAESYFVADEEQDLCPVCYLKISTAEHQKEGVQWHDVPDEVPDERPPLKKKKRTTKKG